MLPNAIQAFNDKVATSPELQAKLSAITSPVDFLTLAKEQGFELTGQELKEMAQQAYQQWLNTLDLKLGAFFRQMHETKALDDRLKICRSVAEVIALGQECGFKLSEDDLHRAAAAAEALPGFSFEKLWFRGLGIIR